ncbi:MAG TPA: SHOCT domain-containing protein [Ktedonobacteraceae bacterium]|jgi:putative membrane protein|nr:SHOCT domain-containing protein [Ktedonobacteraceae bacterium]
MFWGFHGLWLLLPFVLFFKFFWILLLVLFIATLVRGFGRRMAYRGQTPFYTPGMPPVQPSALEILRQRYARGEIDATTYEQMRERLEASSRPNQQ